MGITISAEPNTAPTASAGDDQSHMVAHDGDPADQGVDVTVCGSSSDAEGDNLSYSWSSGEDTECISANLTAGSYSYTFTSTDAYGASSSDDMSVTISAEENEAPYVDAGDDLTASIAHDGAPADQLSLIHI